MPAALDFLNIHHYKAYLGEWLFAALMALLGSVLLIFLRNLLISRVEKINEQKGSFELFLSLLKESTYFFFISLSFYLTTTFFELQGKLEAKIDKAFILVLLVQAGFWGEKIISHYVKNYRQKHLELDAAGVTTVSVIGIFGKLSLYILLALMGLANVGVNITALITGLGIGGIAVALAVQNILSDLLASLSIALDKPFAVGDLIQLDEKQGTVEYIGLKTTRVRSISGEELIVSNADLLKSRIRNFKRMQERRIVFNIGVLYESGLTKLSLIPKLIEEAIVSVPNVRFDRAHFKSYGDFSLVYEAVYYVTDADYNVYMNANQLINLNIYESFSKEGVEFAYPTSVQYVKSSESKNYV